MSKSIAIIGGGAAGFFAAIQAARSFPDAFITIFEGSGKPLAKVLISGGGRCNVTNDTRDVTELVQNYPRGSKELRGPFSRFAVADTIKWFENEGVQLKTEPDKRMFPITDSSETIASTLRRAAENQGIELRLKQKVVSLQKQDDGSFRLKTQDDSEIEFGAVILTSGGSKQSFALAQNLGHTIIAGVPSLFTFEIEDPLIDDLAGLSFPEAQLKLSVAGKKFEFSGPVLITHWGLSGPAIIKLSALAARELHASSYDARLTIAFLSRTADAHFETLAEIKERKERKQMKSLIPFELPKRFWERVLEITGVSSEIPYAEASNKNLRRISQTLGNYRFQVQGKGVFKEEFVTCGGVSLKEVNFKTMESKKAPGLYFAGEVLNIDGITGGFNFQSAWTTGWIAGSSCGT